MAIIGTQLTSGTGVTWQKIGTAGNNNQRGLMFFTAAQPGFLTHLGMRARRDGSNNPKPQLGVYNVGTTLYPPPDVVTSATRNYAPVGRLGYTNAITVGAGASSSGLIYESAIAHSAWDLGLGVEGVAVRLITGQKYCVVVHNQDAGLEIAVRPSPPIITSFQENKPNGDPTDPFQSGEWFYATGPVGDLYAVWTPSTAPIITVTGPVGSVSTSTPTITANSFDPDFAAPFHDRLASYVIEVRQAGQQFLIWQSPTFPATGTERATETISRLYSGPALPAGQWEVRIQGTDDTGAVGAFSPWHTFTVGNLPSVSVANAIPTAKQESGTINSWAATWVSPSGRNATAVQVRILSGGTPIRSTADWVTIPAVSPNGQLLIADTHASLQLTRGVNGPLPSGFYTWQMMARDTALSASAWSPEVPISINFPPNTPTNLRPTSGTRVSTPPRVDWLLSDPDADDVLGVGLVSEWKVTRVSTGAAAQAQTSAVDPATGRGYHQFTGTQFPADGMYQVEVRGVDLSAVAAGTGVGGWSAPILLEKITAPTVAVTSPSPNQEFLTGSPQIAFTVTPPGMLFYRIELYRTFETNPFFGSGLIAAIDPLSGLYSIPPGVLANGQFYDVRVAIIASDENESYSPKVRFKVQFPQADIVTNVTSVLYQGPWDHEPVSVQLAWGPTNYLANQFGGWVITRRLSDEPESTAVVIAYIRTLLQQSYIDYHAPPNTDLTYGVSQLKRAGADIQQGPVSDTNIVVGLTVPVVTSLLQGSELRSPVIMLSDDYSEGFAKVESTIPTWGTGGVPTLVRSPSGYGQRLYSVGFRIRNESHGTVQQHMARWRDLVRSGHPMTLRTETEVVYCRIAPQQNWLRRSTSRGVYEVALTLEEIAWSEAVRIQT